jgi:phosphoribosylformylglycinamidine synthase
MLIRVEVAPLRPRDDVRGPQLAAQGRLLGVSSLTSVRVHDLFFLDVDTTDSQRIERIIQTLLQDPVIEDAQWRDLANASEESSEEGVRVVEVAPQPGVTDTVAGSFLEAARALGFDDVRQAATGTRYHLTGGLDDPSVRRLATGLLANEVVHAWAIDQEVEAPFIADTIADDTVASVSVRGASDDDLMAISSERRLSLDLPEMQAIRAHFTKVERDPTDVELEMLAQTWSEHCVHKTFKAHITSIEDGEEIIIDSMYRSYIKAATKAVATPWLKSVFVDNAGIVGFDDQFDLAFKVETHNHPSALEPFGGANTGVGGVVRDVIGVSARPIATTDVLCFGPPDLSPDALPEGVLHPRRIADGVIAGVGDYGNKMGIPTVDGAIVYDPGYTANPLVYCGCLGILPKDSHPTSPQVGDLVVVVGGRTGRDGLRGATFSSMEMSVETSEIAGTSVQIGHPIQEKMVLDAILVARDEKLYSAITDCGAGGLSSAIGEMACKLGAHVQLLEIPLKYAGLAPWEVWLSEAQERMVLAVPPSNWARLDEICKAHSVEATALGTFTGDERMKISYGDRVIGDLDVHFLHDGLPQRRLRAEWSSPTGADPQIETPTDLGPTILKLLAMPDVRSKEDVVRTFDHEVQGGTVVKPFVGVDQSGPSDATVLWPLDTVEAATGTLPEKGVALSVAINPQLGKVDPYAMAWALVDEALRNAVAVGADPDQVAILDNFCWGNPKLPDRLGGLVRCARGCHDAAVAYRAPFISGKDSLNNEYTGADGDKHAIPGTLLVSALALVPSVHQTVTMDLKQAGNALYMVGATQAELGGSVWYRLHGELGVSVPMPPTGALEDLRRLHQAIRRGTVRSCHDCSEGGVSLAVAEMALAGHHGAQLDLAALPGAKTLADPIRAFSESCTRFIVEVASGQEAAFEDAMKGTPCARVGEVRADDKVVLSGEGGTVVASLSVAELTQAWRGHIN